MNLDQIIQTFRTKYSRLAETASLGSIERHAYEQIVRWIDDGLQRVALNPETNTPKQRGFQVAILLQSLAQGIDEPRARQIIRACANDFARETGFNDFAVR